MYRSVKNLISILEEAVWDPSTKTWKRPPFTPGNLDYHFTGDSADLKTSLLQKSNGDFYLLTWLDVDSSTKDQKDMDVERTLNLNLATPCRVTRYDFNDHGDLATSILSEKTTSTPVVVRDRVVVLRLTP